MKRRYSKQKAENKAERNVTKRQRIKTSRRHARYLKRSPPEDRLVQLPAELLRHVMSWLPTGRHHTAGLRCASTTLAHVAGSYFSNTITTLWERCVREQLRVEVHDISTQQARICDSQASTHTLSCAHATQTAFRVLVLNIVVATLSASELERIVHVQACKQSQSTLLPVSRHARPQADATVVLGSAVSLGRRYMPLVGAIKRASKKTKRPVVAVKKGRDYICYLFLR